MRPSQGHRTEDGHLTIPLKKGVFHMQQQAQVPLIPLAIKGAYELYPPGCILARPGRIYVSRLPLLPPFDTSGSDSTSAVAASQHREETRLKLEHAMAAELAKPVVPSERHTGSGLPPCLHYPLTSDDVNEQLFIVVGALAT